MTTQIYMDYNATAPVFPAVIDAMAAALAHTGNASSVHGFGRAARKMVENARQQIAETINARPAQIIFTGGGTESNNTALQCFKRERIFISAVEHESMIKHKNANIIPVDQDGMVSPETLDRILSQEKTPALISIMLANNETGVIQPIADLVEIAKKHNALFHVDAAQALGKIPVNFAKLNIDALTLSAHKFGGPMGVGALVVKEEMPFTAFLSGGGQERYRRAGTENIPAIVGFGVACMQIAKHQLRWEKIENWRNDMEQKIKRIAPETIFFGEKSDRLPNTSCFATPGWAAEKQVLAMDLSNIAIGSGSACSSGKVEPSHVLKAMGANTEQTKSAIRISMGWQTKQTDVQTLIKTWQGLYQKQQPTQKKAS